MVRWNSNEVQEYLYEQEALGTPIKEIAEHFGVSTKAVHVARTRMGLTQRRPSAQAILERTVRVTGQTDDGSWTAYKNLMYCVLGLSGEAGELAGETKKVYRNDGGKLTKERRDKIVDELGDVLWYAQALCFCLNISLEEVAQLNQTKLFERKRQGQINDHG